MELPSTLTPNLLGQILRYARNHRRMIEADIEQECKDSWQHCGTDKSDQDFYAQLHKFIQNPIQRKRFNRIAEKHSKKQRKLELNASIFKHYQRTYPGILTTKRSKRGKEFILEVVRKFSTYDDIECLTNVVWAFIDDRLIDFQDVQEFEPTPIW